MERNFIKKQYEKYCNAYLQLFCEKHDFDVEDAIASWVASDIGGVALCGDYCVNMQTIKADIDFNPPEDVFFEWYDYCMNAAEFELPSPNFESWIKGCPRTPDVVFDKLRMMKNELQSLVVEERNKLKY